MTDVDVPGPIGRRSLLRAAVAVPAAGAAAGPRFAIAVLPDTQYLFDEDSSRPEPLKATFEYLPGP